MADEIIIPDPPSTTPSTGRGRGAETVTVIRKPRVDRLGTSTEPTLEFEIKDCLLWPRASLEDGKGWVQVAGYGILFPPGTDIRATDQVRARGELHAVEGKPGDYGKKGIIATLKSVSSG